ncbi:molybdenum cofactor biosynthesis protein MoaE [Leekyejoonella antrihumi]|uniref:Molybdopterin synthase catalytic subunit 1 n=1 Tax=Leekyejoonella antrihumi TaxID=1660198 RepID=A0A563DYJ5_9MICO|nr:molybdenum cofactor biosynthesis protein MoaE [Leekyejoonella antrihumi]TWP35310.1 molybdenum cofactor biosynthesis protein MoaE [Leekyejoonella antrihumi]
MSTPRDPRIRLIDIRDEPLSVDEVMQAVRDDRAGGIALFVGQVRSQDQGLGVQQLDYTAHPTAVEELARVAAEVLTEEVTAIAAIHRIGTLRVGDLAVVVAAAAPHRGDALTVCSAMIDTLKHQVPIWKHQAFSDGTDEWVGLP